MPDQLPEENRKELFRTLVESQDQGTTVKDSRTHMASQFNITIEQVHDIEREGINKQWPPLSD